MSHQAVSMYRLGLKNKKMTFLKFILFQNSCHIEGEHSAQTVYDIV